MLYVLRPTKLTCPLAIGQLPCCMRIENHIAIECDLLVTRFIGLMRADDISKGLEELFQRTNAVVPCFRCDGPIYPWLPPVPNVACRPGDAVVIGRWRAGNAVVLIGEPRKVRAMNHG